GTTPASTHHFGMSEPLTTNGFTRLGYAFAGWATTTDGVVAYTDGQNVQDLATTAGYTFNLYAVWTAQTVNYTVNHQWMNLDGLTYTNHDTDTLSALSGTEVTPSVKTYSGFVSPSSQTVTVAGDGSTEVNYYYTRIKYDLNWDFNGGSVQAGAYTLAGQYFFEEPITVPNVAYAGYNLAGWLPATPTLMPDSNVTYVAQWTPATNTTYIVNHFCQTLGGTYPATPTESDTLAGTTDAEVTPAVKTYTGFTAPVTQTVTIAADGSTVVNYYYLRNAYTLTWTTDGDPLVGSYLYGLVMYETPIAQPATPTKTGYTFDTWTPAVAATMPDSDVTYTATWIADTTIAYTVEYYRADLTGTYPDTLKEVVLKYDGTADAVKTVVPEKSYTGFVTPAAKNETIAADGSTVIRFDYERMIPTLTWNTLGGTIDSSSLFTPAGPVIYETPIVAPVGATRVGYDFVAWTGVPTTMPDSDVICVATYTPRNDTKYTVLHYLMNENGVGYTLDSTQIFQGTTGDTITPDTLIYEGFISPVRLSDTIAADGSTTITYEYVRVTHTLTWVMNGGTPDASIPYTAAGTQFYGISIVAPVVSKVGYDFAAWTPVVPALMPDSDVTFSATFTPRTDTKYTVQHLLMNTDGVGYLLDSTQIFQGTTGDSITPDTLIYEGFVSPARLSDTIAADGSTLIRYYYDRRQYDITFNNWNDTTLEVVPTYYGTLPIPTILPTKDSTIQFVYTFAGWDPELVITTRDTTYTATFTEEVRQYPVTFYNYDSVTVVLDTMVMYGNTPSCSIIPTRDSDARYDFQFREWSPAIVPVSGETNYYAVYDSIIVWYNVHFVNYDGAPVFDTVVHYGDTASCPVIPTRDADAQFTYVFNSWNPLVDTTTIVCDTVFTACYDSVLNDYVIRFLNDKDTLQVDTLDYGTLPVYTGLVPERDSTAEFSYIFRDWSPVIDTVRGEQDYHADYDSIRNKYLIRFVNWNDTLLQQDSVLYGDMPVYNEALYGIPHKDTTDHFNYQFAGWDPVIAPVVGPEKYVALYDSLINPDECWCDSAPAVELYEWLLILDARALHNMGYKFSDADVYWFQTTGDNYEPADTLGTPLNARKDILISTGYYFTNDKPLTGTGAYYAEIILPQPQDSSQLCQDFMRTAPFLFSPSKLLLAPSLVTKNEPIRLYGLHEGETATLQIFTATGQLVATYTTEAGFYEWTNAIAGTYIIHVNSESFNETFKYIVK
ncbi:MAG: InlB B-repeat-containing protein, partial [Bacteroidales bacterium]|nr:InlB B-repeat-containing protein [Candidatus Colicola coprequi]